MENYSNEKVKLLTEISEKLKRFEKKKSRSTRKKASSK